MRDSQLANNQQSVCQARIYKPRHSCALYTTTLTLLTFPTKNPTHFSLVFSSFGKNGSDEVVAFDIWNQRLSEWYDALQPQMLVYMFNSRPLHVLIFCYLLLYKDKSHFNKRSFISHFVKWAYYNKCFSIYSAPLI